MKQECTSLVYGKGKTTLPKAVRQYLNIDDGALVVYTINNNLITIHSENAMATSLKKMVTAVTKSESLVNELIKDRRKEVKYE